MTIAILYQDQDNVGFHCRSTQPTTTTLKKFIRCFAYRLIISQIKKREGYKRLDCQNVSD